MRVKIIKDYSSRNYSTIDISKYIGLIFKTTPTPHSENIDVDFGDELGVLAVYKGEYEIVEE